MKEWRVLHKDDLDASERPTRLANLLGEVSEGVDYKNRRENSRNEPC
jgi:hypothetical protein